MSVYYFSAFFQLRNKQICYVRLRNIINECSVTSYCEQRLMTGQKTDNFKYISKYAEYI